MEPWIVIAKDEDEPFSFTHVIPIRDLRDHEMSAECWCHPTEDEDEPRILVHHSADGREMGESPSTHIH